MSGSAVRQHSLDLAGIALGSAVQAAAVAFFITGCGLIPCGITGAAAIINRLWGFPMGGAVFIFSGLILVAGLIFLGMESFGKTLFCIAAYSGSIELATRLLPAFAGSRWLAAILGGVLVGLSTGLILRSRGSLGTSDLIALILHKYFGLSVSGAILVMDFIPIIIGAILFEAEALLPSAIYLVVLTQVIALLQPKKARVVRKTGQA